jgi:hypothetical protein
VPDPSKPRPYQYLGVGLILGGEETVAVLRQLGATDVYEARFRIPVPPPAEAGTLVFGHAQVTVSHDAYEEYGHWFMPLKAPGANNERRDSGVVLDINFAPGNPSAVPDEVSDGYHLVATINDGADFRVLTVNVTLHSMRERSAARRRRNGYSLTRIGPSGSSRITSPPSMTTG